MPDLPSPCGRKFHFSLHEYDETSRLRFQRTFTEVTELRKEIVRSFSPSQTVQAPLFVALIRPIVMV